MNSSYLIHSNLRPNEARTRIALAIVRCRVAGFRAHLADPRRRHVKFLADMGISPRTVAYLREHGHEAIRLDALGMVRATDPAVVTYAASKGSIVLACDLDYPEIITLAHAQSPSCGRIFVNEVNPRTADRAHRLGCCRRPYLCNVTTRRGGYDGKTVRISSTRFTILQ